MRIVRYAPRKASMNMMNDFDRFFRSDAPTNVALALDVVENEDAYMVKASLPGVSPDDVEILFEDKVLSIKGEVQAEEEAEGETYHIRERRSGSFSRSLRFPVDVDADAIEATYEHGVLTLSVPKAEAVKPKRIEVKAG